MQSLPWLPEKSSGRVQGLPPPPPPGANSVKLVALVTVPAGVVTAAGPVVAFGGTVAVICALVLTVKAAGAPLNLTEVAPVNAAPMIVTLVPGVPLVGDNAVICATLSATCTVLVEATQLFVSLASMMIPVSSAQAKR
jgi:hypothetical protein